MPTVPLCMCRNNKVEAECNDNLHLRLYWDMTGRSRGVQGLQDSLAVLEGQGDHFCLEPQENPAKTQTEQIQTSAFASSCKGITGQILPFLMTSVQWWWETCSIKHKTTTEHSGKKQQTEFTHGNPSELLEPSCS